MPCKFAFINKVSGHESLFQIMNVFWLVACNWGIWPKSMMCRWEDNSRNWWKWWQLICLLMTILHLQVWRKNTLVLLQLGWINLGTEIIMTSSLNMSSSLKQQQWKTRIYVLIGGRVEYGYCPGHKCTLNTLLQRSSYLPHSSSIFNYII